MPLSSDEEEEGEGGEGGEGERGGGEEEARVPSGIQEQEADDDEGEGGGERVGRGIVS